MCLVPLNFYVFWHFTTDRGANLQAISSLLGQPVAPLAQRATMLSASSHCMDTVQLYDIVLQNTTIQYMHIHENTLEGIVIRCN